MAKNYVENKNHKKWLFPIVGIHTSGKSTLLSTLNKYGMITEEEIADKIRREQGVKAGAAADISFEYLIRSEEEKRDSARDWSSSDFIFVESWHILTVAYMLTRGAKKKDVSEYLNYISEIAKDINIFCIFLMSDPKLILNRSRKLHCEKDIDKYQDFYMELQDNIMWVLDNLDISFKVFDSRVPYEVVKNDILNYLFSELNVKMNIE